MTLLAIYETPSERKQRRNKLEVGRPGWCPRCALISQLRQHFFCFYGHLYGPVFGTLNQGPEGERAGSKAKSLAGNSTSRYHLIWRSR